MKKISIIIVTLVMVLLLASCVNDNNNAKESILNSINTTQVETTALETEKVLKRMCDELGAPDQSGTPIFMDFEDPELDKIDDVENSFYIEFYDKKDTYTLDENIKIRIESIGELTFQMFSYPYLEKYDDESNTWVRIIYAPDEAYYEWSSLVCYGGSVLTFKPYYVYDNYTPGTYRLIAFVNDTPIYSPVFNVI